MNKPWTLCKKSLYFFSSYLTQEDLSRLGRSNADMLVYIERMEGLGIRIITYDNTYDSATGSEILGIQTWFNERYVRDISKKIRSTLHHKISSGEFVGRAPYGYIKSRSVHNRLEPDSAKAASVQSIFRLFLEGYTYSQIGYIMNEMGCEAPGGEACKWNCGNVKRVLTNRVYAGDTVQGTSEKISYKSKKTRKLPQSEWVITEHTHTPIVDKEIFREANRMIMRMKKRNSKNQREVISRRYSAVCGACKAPMYRISGNSVSYVCSQYHKYGRTFCTAHRLPDTVLHKCLREAIRHIFEDSAAAGELPKICDDVRPEAKEAAVCPETKKMAECDTIKIEYIVDEIKLISVYTGSEYRSEPHGVGFYGEYLCSFCNALNGKNDSDQADCNKTIKTMPPFVADGDICVLIEYSVCNDQTCKSLSIRR